MVVPYTAPYVDCQFCREPIEITSFMKGKPDSRILSVLCANCGLRICATPETLAAFSRRDETFADEADLARRMRATRVATGARAILCRIGAARPA